MRIKNIILLLIFIFVINGCATSPKQKPKEPSMEEKFVALTVKNLENLSIGMSKSEALEVMRAGLSDFPEWLYTFNPFRSETLKIKGKTLEVLYYYVDMRGREGVASDDELIPIVFEKGKLSCWGWECFKNQ